MAAPVPEKNGFAEAGTRGDERFIGVRAWNALIQYQKIFGRQLIESAGRGRDVVHEYDLLHV